MTAAHSRPSTAVATTGAAPVRSITVEMANRYGMEADAFEATLRGTVVPAATTRPEFAAFLLVAREYKLNPVTREIYAFPKKGGGIQPIVSIDGWSSIVNQHPQFDGMEFEDDRDANGKVVSVLCRMFRKDRSRPTAVREYLDECVMGTEPWKRWPYRMLRHKAMIQCARMAFGFSGIVDDDEAQRMVEIEVVSNQLGAPARLSAGFGDETDQTFRQGGGEAAGASSDAGAAQATAEPAEGGQGAAPAAGEAIDAEFEDATPHDPTTGEVFEEEEVSDSAEDGFDPGPAATTTDPAFAVSDEIVEDAGHPDQREGHAAPDENYVLAGEAPNDKGRRQTYKNGEGFSTVQAANAGKLPEYKIHPPKPGAATDQSQDSSSGSEQAADGGFPGDAKPSGGTTAATPLDVFNAKCDQAATWADLKAALREFSTSSAWSALDPEGKRTIRVDLWDRVIEVREKGATDTDPALDPQLFRIFGEVAVEDDVLVGTWSTLIRQEAYLRLMQEQKDGLKAFVSLRRQAIAEAG